MKTIYIDKIKSRHFYLYIYTKINYLSSVAFTSITYMKYGYLALMGDFEEGQLN